MKRIHLDIDDDMAARMTSENDGDWEDGERLYAMAQDALSSDTPDSATMVARRLWEILSENLDTSCIEWTDEEQAALDEVVG